MEYSEDLAVLNSELSLSTVIIAASQTGGGSCRLTDPLFVVHTCGPGVMPMPNTQLIVSYLCNMHARMLSHTQTRVRAHTRTQSHIPYVSQIILVNKVLVNISVEQDGCHCMSGGLSIQHISILVKAGESA